SCFLHPRQTAAWRGFQRRRRRGRSVHGAFQCNGWHTTMASITPQSLRCEHLDTPLIVHRARPRLSWTLKATDPAARNLKQTAYRVLIASTADLLAHNEADLWDSD